MCNVLILEDDQIQCENIYQCVKSAFPDWSIMCSHNYSDAKSSLIQSIEEKALFSIFLLDIQLEDDCNNYGGFTFSEDIRSIPEYYRTPILFLTSIPDKISYALSNYHCYNYLTKPYSNEDIILQINQLIFSGYLTNHSIIVKDTNQITYKIAFDDIYIIEARSHSIKIITAHGDIITRTMTFQSIRFLLPENFIMCHRKFIINSAYINNYDVTNRYVQVGTYSISVSRTYKHNIEEGLKGIRV